ncbi:MAG: MaoC family dehydratase [Solirubrobacteraceae bacterium]
MPVRELSSSPPMPLLFARAGVAMVPFASRLPFVGGGGQDIPDLTLVLNDVAVEPGRVEAYGRVCGLEGSGLSAGTLPPTYPHMLAFPLQLSLMTDGSFPFPAMGLVHIYNRIVQHRPLSVSERLTLRVWSGPVEPHPRGRQFSIHTEARVGDELVWEEISTNLKRGGGDSAAEAPDVPSAADLPVGEEWKLGGDLGRRYGSVSGDLNPIHVHPLTARLFGFPSAIAHGMWTKARCLAALSSRLPDAFNVEAAFRRPIVLPATVALTASPGEGTASGDVGFGVRDADKDTPHLDGRLTPISAGS